MSSTESAGDPPSEQPPVAEESGAASADAATEAPAAAETAAPAPTAEASAAQATPVLNNLLSKPSEPTSGPPSQSTPQFASPQQSPVPRGPPRPESRDKYAATANAVAAGAGAIRHPQIAGVQAQEWAQPRSPASPAGAGGYPHPGADPAQQPPPQQAPQPAAGAGAAGAAAQQQPPHPGALPPGAMPPMPPGAYPMPGYPPGHPAYWQPRPGMPPPGYGMPPGYPPYGMPGQPPHPGYHPGYPPHPGMHPGMRPPHMQPPPQGQDLVKMPPGPTPMEWAAMQRREANPDGSAPSPATGSMTEEEKYRAALTPGAPHSGMMQQQPHPPPAPAASASARKEPSIIERLVGPPTAANPIEVMPVRRQFFEKLVAFCERHGEPITMIPQVSKQNVDLHRLYIAVRNKGGFEQVTKDKAWKMICCEANPDISESSAAGYQLRRHYQKHLLLLECMETGRNVDDAVAFADKLKKKKKEPAGGAAGASAAATPGAAASTPGGPGTPVGAAGMSAGAPSPFPGGPPPPGAAGYYGAYGAGFPPPPGAMRPPHMPPDLSQMSEEQRAAYLRSQQQQGADGAAPATPYSQPPASVPPPASAGGGESSRAPSVGPNGAATPDSSSRMSAPDMSSDRPASSASTTGGAPSGSSAGAPGATPSSAAGTPAAALTPGGSAAPPASQPSTSMAGAATPHYGQPPPMYAGAGGAPRPGAPPGAGYPGYPPQGFPPHGYPPPPPHMHPQQHQHYMQQQQMWHAQQQAAAAQGRYPPPGAPGAPGGARGYYGGPPPTPQQQAQQQQAAAAQQARQQQLQTPGAGGAPSPGASTAQRMRGYPSTPLASSTGSSAASSSFPPASTTPLRAPPPTTAAQAQAGTVQPPGPAGSIMIGSNYPQQQQQQQQSTLFPPGSVEASSISQRRRRRMMARDLIGATPRRLLLTLRSAMDTEVVWALNALTVILHDDGLTPPALNQMPGLLNAVVDHLLATLHVLWPQEFELPEMSNASSSTTWDESEEEERIKSALKGPSDAVKAVVTVREKKGASNSDKNAANYTKLTRTGRKVHYKEVEMPEELKRRLLGEMKEEKEECAPSSSSPSSSNSNPPSFDDPSSCSSATITMFPSSSSSSAFRAAVATVPPAVLHTNSLVARVAARLRMSLEASRAMQQPKFRMRELTETERAAMEDEKTQPQLAAVKQECVEVDDESEDTATAPFFFRLPNRMEAAEYPNDVELDSFRPTALINRDAAIVSLTQRALALSNIVRGFSFMHGNELTLAGHATLLGILAKFLKLCVRERIVKKVKPPTHDDDGHPSTSTASSSTLLRPSFLDSEDSVDALLHEVSVQLREDAFTVICHLSVVLDLYDMDSRVSYDLLDGLIHWAVSATAEATDNLLHGIISPRDYALEALCKLCVLERNVDLLLSTGSWPRIERLVKVLARLLPMHEESHHREFSIVILNALCLGSEAVCWTTAVETNAINHLLNFIEAADLNMHSVMQSHGMNALRDNPEMMGTSVGMLRRAASVVKLLTKVRDARKTYAKQQSRLIQFTMSQLMDSRVAAMVAESLFEIQRAESEYEKEERGKAEEDASDKKRRREGEESTVDRVEKEEKMEVDEMRGKEEEDKGTANKAVNGHSPTSSESSSNDVPSTTTKKTNGVKGTTTKTTNSKKKQEDIKEEDDEEEDENDDDDEEEEDDETEDSLPPAPRKSSGRKRGAVAAVENGKDAKRSKGENGLSSSASSTSSSPLKRGNGEISTSKKALKLKESSRSENGGSAMTAVA